MNHNVTISTIAFSALLFSIAGAEDAPTPPLAGAVVDDAGEGLEGWVIALSSGQKSDPTTQAGYWAFSSLPPGDYEVTLEAKEGFNYYQPSSGKIEITLGTEPQSLVFRVTTRGAVIGKVTYSDGTPMDGWQLTLLPQGTVTHTDEDGFWGFGHLENGRYLVQLMIKDGYQLVSPKADPDDEDDDPASQLVTLDSNKPVKAQPFVVASQPTVGFNLVQFPGKPLAGWTVELRPTNTGGNSSLKVRTALTNKEGRAEFVNVVEGDYVASLAIQDGFSFVTPKDGRQTVHIDEPGTHPFDFTVAKQGSIFGTLYRDLAQAGQIQSAYPLLADWKVYLDEDDNGYWDEGEPMTLTNKQGEYSFDGLFSGSYTVRLETAENWYLTEPAAESWEVTLRNRYQQFRKDFGTQQFVTVQGTVFHDSNKNGRLDAGEPGLPDWNVSLKQAEQIVRSTKTGAEGTYEFTRVLPGDYQVVQDVVDDWQATAPTTFAFQLGNPHKLLFSSAGIHTINDFRRDGTWDVFNSRSLYRGNPDFTEIDRDSGQTVSLNFNPTAITSADIDGDEDIDIVTLGEHKKPGLQLALNQADGNFETKLISENPKATGFSGYAGFLLVDYLTPDTYADIVFRTVRSGAYLLANQGDLEFKEQLLSSGAVHSIGSGDLERDGDVDLVLLQDDGVHILHNQGDGTFVDEKTIALSHEIRPGAIVVTDFDGDRFPDIAVTNDRTLYVHLNNGSGSFYQIWSHTFDFDAQYAFWGTSFLAGDLDNDRDQDLVIGGRPFGVLINGGRGVFSVAEFSGSGWHYHLQLYDLDGDRLQDITSSYESNLTARRNESNRQPYYQRGFTGGKTYRLDFGNAQ